MKEFWFSIYFIFEAMFPPEKLSLKFASQIHSIQRTTEAALRRCSQEKVFWKYAANLQENTYAEYLQDLDKFI